MANIVKVEKHALRVPLEEVSVASSSWPFKQVKVLVSTSLGGNRKFLVQAANHDRSQNICALTPQELREWAAALIQLADSV